MPNQPVSGTLQIQDSTTQPQVTITLDGNTADVILGKNSTDERIRLGEIQDIVTPGKPKPGAAPPEVSGQPLSQYWGLRARNAKGTNVIELGVNDLPNLVLRNSLGNEMVRISVPIRQSGVLAFEVPSIVLNNPLLTGESTETVSVEGNGEITVGGGGSRGLIRIRTQSGEDRISLNGDDGHIGILFTQLGSQLEVVSLDGRADNSSVRLRVANPNPTDPFGTVNRIRLEAKEGGMWLGGNGADSTIVLFDKNGDNGTMSKASIIIDGAKGDIVLQNADCAEEFEISDTADVEPGTVMVIEKDGRLRPSDGAYDRRVAGVISGAGGCRPAITLAKTQSAAGRMPVALVGRVLCKADASDTPIEVGDLLTTASRTGHAMKASEPERAFGAVLGKALAPLRSGTDLIPILVTLQ